MSSSRPYQGYPYVNPTVYDAPSIDPATASRWNNLPRKQIELPVKRTKPVIYVNKPDEDTESRAPGRVSLPKKPDPDPAPVVYIDMPEASGSPVVAGRRESSSSEETEPATSSSRDDKRDPGDDPVVYIDLPDDNGTDVTSPQAEEPEFVQNTIFFDPFENRRIEMHKQRRESESEDEGSTVSGPTRPLPPIRPSSLDPYGAGSSGAGASSSFNDSSTPGLPALMSKEAMLYQGADDRFPMSPIPVTEFPEPPPSYAEIDRVSSPIVDIPLDRVTEQPRTDDPPRTQVILPRDHQPPITPMGIPNLDRKYLNCHHCGMRVHTLVIRENGTVTHATALLCLLLCVIPIIIWIYCTDYLKVKNHYCPSCNKIIGYELPFRSNKIVYVN